MGETKEMRISLSNYISLKDTIIIEEVFGKWRIHPPWLISNITSASNMHRIGQMQNNLMKDLMKLAD